MYVYHGRVLALYKRYDVIYGKCIIHRLLVLSKRNILHSYYRFKDTN